MTVDRSPLARIEEALGALVPSSDQRDLCRAAACCRAAARRPLRYDRYGELARLLRRIGDRAARGSAEYYLAWALVATLAGRPATADALLRGMAGTARRRAGVGS